MQLPPQAESQSGDYSCSSKLSLPKCSNATRLAVNILLISLYVVTTLREV